MRDLSFLLAAGTVVLALSSCGSSSTPSSPSAPAPTHTFTITSTSSDTPTITPTDSPTDTPTNSPTITPSSTPSNSPTITETPTCTNSPTNSPTPTISNTPTQTYTPTVTFTPTNTFTPTITFTAVYPFQQIVASGAAYSSLAGIAAADSGTGSVTLLVTNSTYLDYFTGTATGSFTHSTLALAKADNPIGVAWSSYNSNFYVVASDSGSADYIQRFTASGGNPGGGAPVTFASTQGGAYYVAVAASGHVFVADYGAGSIQEYDDLGNPVGSAWGSYTTSIRSMAYDPVNNQLAFTLSKGGGPSLVRVNLDGSSPTTFTSVSSPSIPNNTWVVNFDAAGHLFIATSAGASPGNVMFKYTNALSLLTPFGPGNASGGHLYSPSAFTIDSQGYVYVTNPTINSDIVEYAPY